MSPDRPDLYKAINTLYTGNEITDKYETVFGIRSVKWTADSGFYLNGKHLFILGANVHQDNAGWGDAVTNAWILRDVKIRYSGKDHPYQFSQCCTCTGGGSAGDRKSNGLKNRWKCPVKKRDIKKEYVSSC